MKDDEGVRQLTYPFEFKAEAVKEDGSFDGFASVFGNVDDYSDIVMPGAFRETIAGHAKAGTMPKMLYQHDPSSPVGVWTNMTEEAKGLRVNGRLILDVPKAREVHALMKAKALDGLSIGYRTLRKEVDETTGVRKLLAVDLREVSIVTFPANDQARVCSVKTVRDLERILRDAGFSRKDAVAIASRGFRAFEERDALEESLPVEIRSVADQIRAIVAQVK